MVFERVSCFVTLLLSASFLSRALLSSLTRGETRWEQLEVVSRDSKAFQAAVTPKEKLDHGHGVLNALPVG